MRGFSKLSTTGNVTAECCSYFLHTQLNSCRKTGSPNLLYSSIGRSKTATQQIISFEFLTSKPQIRAVEGSRYLGECKGHFKRLQQKSCSNYFASSSNIAEPVDKQPSNPKKEPGWSKLYAKLCRIAAVVLLVMQQACPPQFEAEQPGKGSVKGTIRSFRMAATLMPFASLGMGGTTFLMTKAVGSFMKTYLLLLFLRVLLSWFPAFNWERQPWLTLRQMTDPYLQLFRGLIPPLLGMIDFTPLLGFFILQWLSGLLQDITLEDDVDAWW